MKYSNYLGVVFALALIATCFIPWVYIQSINTNVSGFETGVTSFGKPGIITIFLSVVMLVLFVTPRVWAKRLNVFICALNMAWTFRNYLLLTQCESGECPEKKLGIYLLGLFSVLVLVLSFLPKMSEPLVEREAD